VPEYYTESVFLLIVLVKNIQCFKKSFTTSKACINLVRGRVQRFEPSLCTKMCRVLHGIVTVQCDFQW
jgi:hypothetical protein